MRIYRCHIFLTGLRRIFRKLAFINQRDEIVEYTVKGAAELLLASGNNPEVEIDKVTTAGGITIKGLNEMEHEGFTSAVIKGLKACL